MSTQHITAAVLLFASLNSAPCSYFRRKPRRLPVRLAQITQKQRLMGPAVYELLLAGDHKAAEEVFLECKRAVDNNKHLMEKKEKDLKDLQTKGECSTLKKPLPPADRDAAKAAQIAAMRAAKAAGTGV